MKHLIKSLLDTIADFLDSVARTRGATWMARSGCHRQANDVISGKSPLCQ